jgi:hypothetical protein
MYFIALLLFQKVPGFLRQSDEIDGFLLFLNRIVQGGDRVPVRERFCSLQGARAITFSRRKIPVVCTGFAFQSYPCTGDSSSVRPKKSLLQPEPP